MAPQPSAQAARAHELRTRAKAALLRHEFAHARELLDEAIALHPNSYKLHRLRTVASACLEDYEAALEDAEVVVRLAPGLVDGWYHKAFSLFHLKDYANAAHAFHEGLRLCPADKILRQGYWDAMTLLGQARGGAGCSAASLSGAAASSGGSQHGDTNLLGYGWE